MTPRPRSILQRSSDIDAAKRSSQLTGLEPAHLVAVAEAISCGARRRGRPWTLPLATRLELVCTSLRTNLTFRELAILFSISASQVHRILVDLVPRLAGLLRMPESIDRRHRWLLDGSLIPTRDHRVAKRSKNYRYSCNVQVLARYSDRLIIAIAGGGPGNRNDPVHYRGSEIEGLCRAHGRVLADGGYRGIAELRTPRFKSNRIIRDRRWRYHRKRRARIEHILARLKDWRALRDYRRSASTLVDSARAIAYLHNLKLRNVS
jgi:hypothetical protein